MRSDFERSKATFQKCIGFLDIHSELTPTKIECQRFLVEIQSML
jgi:hypothetical protein